MKYKIGEIATMLGISASALRFFEEYDLIRSTRDEDNGYRMYDPIDLNRFLRIKTYTQCDFSLKESVDILRADDLNVIADLYNDKAEELVKRLRWEEQRLAFLHNGANELRLAQSALFKWSIRPRPAMYVFPFRTKYQIHGEAERRKRIGVWARYKPFSESFQKLSAADLLSAGTDKSQYGLMMEEQYASNFPIACDEYVDYYPRQERCAFTVFQSNTGDGLAPLAEHFCEGMRFIERQGSEMIGDTIGRVLHTDANHNDNLGYITEFWIPIR